MTEEFLTPRQVADEYPFTLSQLGTWRWMGLGPDYIKTTPSKAGRIKYRRSAIERWLKEHTVSHREAA
ncbi:DNA-binding protein [Streptomyces sp. NPDC006333]|uniref:helix-turn-helix transcriptional regulator n=1 Tax=Streptomyces sp. NPDC006333 TaxID=3156753 RepID=UPI00339F3922